MPEELTDQVNKLIASLPRLADRLERADRDHRHNWQVVRWRETAPAEVTLDRVETVRSGELGGMAAKNSFESPTAALRASANYVRSHYPKTQRSERAHWGVWEVRENGAKWFQTVLPYWAGDQQSSTSTTKPDRIHPSGGMVRLGEKAHRQLRLWAKEDGITLQAAAERAVDEYERHRFFEAANAAYRALKADPKAWAEELEERRLWEATLMDGLDPDERWNDDGSAEVEPLGERKSA